MNFFFKSSRSHGFSTTATGVDIVDVLSEDLRRWLTRKNLPTGRHAIYEVSNPEIVEEKLLYIPRLDVEVQIAGCMKTRFDDRSKSLKCHDKTVNPLIALPASPGCGKSTELVHFPESQAYRDYITSRNSTAFEKFGNCEPIVSIFTFNSGMDAHQKISMFPLRLVYGGISAMTGGSKRLLENNYKPIINWKGFGKEFMGYADQFTSVEAVHVLQRLFGDDRPVLVLADEVAKAKPIDAPKEVVTALGSVLNNVGEADVVVSSLSPDFIAELTTGSQRNVDYIFLPTLIDEGLGQKLCEDWGSTMKEEFFKQNRLLDADVNKGRQRNAFVEPLLKNAYLFASGHPRTIERLLVKLQNANSKINQIKGCTSIGQMVRALCSEIKNCCPNGELADEKVAFGLEIILSKRKYSKVSSSKVRKLIEEGDVFMVPRGESNYKLLLPYTTFIDAIQRSVPKDLQPRGRLAKLLFRETGLEVLSQWQRSIALTVACGSVNESDEPLMIEEVFGINSVDSGFALVNVPPLAVRIASNEAETLFRQKDELIIASSRHPGYDLRADFQSAGTQYTVYLQVKLEIKTSSESPSKSAKLLQILAKCITKIVIEHFTNGSSSGTSIENVIIGLYIWETGLAMPSKEVMLSRIKEDENLQVTEFVEKLYDSNVAIVQRPELDEWIIPTLSVVPRLLRKMCLDEDISEA